MITLVLQSLLWCFRYIYQWVSHSLCLECLINIYIYICGKPCTHSKQWTPRPAASLTHPPYYVGSLTFSTRTPMCPWTCLPHKKLRNKNSSSLWSYLPLLETSPDIDDRNCSKCMVKILNNLCMKSQKILNTNSTMLFVRNVTFILYSNARTLLFNYDDLLFRRIINPMYSPSSTTK